MRTLRRPAVALLAAAILPACTLAPAYQRPVSPVPSALPSGGVYPTGATPAPAQIGYRDLVTDARLQGLIEQALVNNRDLRVAAANIQAARAQYRIQRADRVPNVGLTGSGDYRQLSDDAGGGSTRAYAVDVGVNAFELDFFGRVRSLSQAALDRYLATDAAAQAARITLIGDVSDAWSSYAADKTLLAIAEDTARSAEQSVRLTKARVDGGVAPATDLNQARGILAAAEADIADQRTAVAQDLNALQLLVGAPIDPAALPASIDETAGAFALLPAGLDSDVLLRRPDVIQAEYGLRAANADIGAARAALFPRISLTGAAGLASTALSSLFSGGAFGWSAGADVALPIFQGGAGIAGVDQAKAQRDAALATYEGAIQTAFRDVSDALARQGTIDANEAARRAATEAAAATARLTEARYRGGIDSFLTSLDAQRSLYTARRALVASQLTRATNRVALYRALGGGVASAPAP